MRQSFKVSFYLRSNYENKEGKSPVMLRIFLGGAMSNLGSTKIFVDKAQWNSRTSRQKGRSSEALAVNANLDAISANLHSLYHKYQDDQTISLDKLRSAYLGQIQEFSTFLPVFDKFIDDIRQRVGHTISKESLQQYSVLRRHFFEFLVHRYKRKDIGLMEFTPAIIQDFELYLTTMALCAYNTAVKKMKTLKTVTIYALKRGYLLQDPFRDHLPMLDKAETYAQERVLIRGYLSIKSQDICSTAYIRGKASPYKQEKEKRAEIQKGKSPRPMR